jgi:ribosomal protein S18 acetylase RimI-like enzyme
MGIREAGTDDIPLIRNLAEVIWPEAYGDILSEEQLHYMLHLIYSEAALEKQIINGHKFIFVLKDDIEIGFASFSRKSEEEPTVFRLHKIYVLPRQHAQGAGSFMLNYIYEESIRDGAKQLELNVNKYNIAKQFYEKKGFTVLKEEVIDIGNGYVMDDYVMVKDLS